MRDVRERLLDVGEAIDNIERYAARGREAFERDELIQTWMLHHLRIVGEACRAVPSASGEAHPEVPWAKITGSRHILVHRYFGIDLDLVWLIVEHDLPNLKRKVEAVLHELGGESQRFQDTPEGVRRGSVVAQGQVA